MRTAASIVLLLTAALTVGCSSKPDGSGSTSDGSSTSPARDVNKSLTLKHNDGSAKVTLLSVSESYKGEDGTKGKSGNFVAVKLRFECEEGEYSANPLYVKLKKPDGTVVGSDAGNADDAVPLAQSIRSSQMDLIKGTSVEGTVAFDAPYDPGAKLLVTGVMGHILGQWPLSAGEPVLGEGLPKRDINKSVTVKQRDSSALATLVSVTETDGGGALKDTAAPKSGKFVIVDMKIEGKTGTYPVTPLRIQLRKPDGQTIDQHYGNGTYGIDLDAEELQSADLSPGKTAAGKVSFDSALQPGTKIVILDYSEKVLGEWAL